ncbi:lytic transglycosylase domain-containing protein, partial [Paracraurococcus ruber]
MRAFALALLSLLPALAARAQVAEPGLLCRAAIARAEQERGIPPRLLAAIGRVESGRRDPQTGAMHPWPWVINAEGRGSFFPDKAAAIAAVRALQAQGVRSIDVGCLQINLRHHPDAFASLEEAFDPLANARYGARFLSELQATRGDWMLAAANYHSQTPGFAEPYRARVAAAWLAEQDGPATPAAAFAALATPPPPAVR